MTAGPGEKLKTRSVAVAVGIAAEGLGARDSGLGTVEAGTNRKFKWFGKIGVGGKGGIGRASVVDGVAVQSVKTLTLTLSQREREGRFGDGQQHKRFHRFM
jgi:hypothetical protein